MSKRHYKINTIFYWSAELVNKTSLEPANFWQKTAALFDQIGLSSSTSALTTSRMYTSRVVSGVRAALWGIN